MTTKLTVDEVIKELKLEKKENHNIDTIIKEIRKEYTSSDTIYLYCTHRMFHRRNLAQDRQTNNIEGHPKRQRSA